MAEWSDATGLVEGAFDFGAGIYNSYKGAQKSRAEARALEAGLAEQRRLYGQGFDAQSALLKPLQDRGEDAWGQMQGMEFNSAPDAQQFQYDKQLQDFLDPYLQDQIRNANIALEGGQAGKGNLLSSKTMGMLQGNAQNMANKGWGDANQRMWQDKNFTYKTLMDQNRQQRQQWADNYGQMQDKYSRLSNNYNLGNQANGQMGNLLGQQSTQLSNFAGQEAEINAMREKIPTGWDHLLNPQVVGGMGQMLSTGADMRDQYNRDNPQWSPQLHQNTMPSAQGNMGMNHTQWNPTYGQTTPQPQYPNFLGGAKSW